MNRSLSEKFMDEYYALFPAEAIGERLLKYDSELSTYLAYIERVKRMVPVEYHNLYGFKTLLGEHPEADKARGQLREKYNITPNEGRVLHWMRWVVENIIRPNKADLGDSVNDWSWSKLRKHVDRWQISHGLIADLSFMGDDGVVKALPLGLRMPALPKGHAAAAAAVWRRVRHNL